MSKQNRILLLGPAYPYRGGIADTQHELGKAIMRQNRAVSFATFSQLYPPFLFPGKTQFRSDEYPEELKIEQIVHAYNPFQWRKAISKLKKEDPDSIVFRYYTPLLAPVYTSIAKQFKRVKKIALVDNWWPHEPKPWDALLNQKFGKQMDQFATLSKLVGDQIEDSKMNQPIWRGFHPIANNLPHLLPQKQARQQLGWPQGVPIVLFYGLIRQYKGLELLLKAYAEKPLSETNIQLAVVGECYQNPNKYLQLIEKLNLKNKILLDLNFADKQKTQRVFSAANAVVQTYHKATQSGVTPLAYHYTKPILASDIDGLREPIANDKTGLLTDKTPKGIAKNLTELVDPTNLILFENQLRACQKKYQWDHFAKNLLDFVESG